jgi:hypothetical protein
MQSLLKHWLRSEAAILWYAWLVDQILGGERGMSSTNSMNLLAFHKTDSKSQYML